MLATRSLMLLFDANDGIQESPKVMTLRLPVPGFDSEPVLLHNRALSVKKDDSEDSGRGE